MKGHTMQNEAYKEKVDKQDSVLEFNINEVLLWSKDI